METFRNDPACKVFLSTDAGGVGLNLQAASAVVNFEPPWNPARLEQRIGRVHRMGQSRPVHVVHMLTSESIEERVWETLRLKKRCSGSVRLDHGRGELCQAGAEEHDAGNQGGVLRPAGTAKAGYFSPGARARRD